MIITLSEHNIAHHKWTSMRKIVLVSICQIFHIREIESARKEKISYCIHPSFFKKWTASWYPSWSSAL